MGIQDSVSQEEMDVNKALFKGFDESKRIARTFGKERAEPMDRNFKAVG